jgi:hypothetical protein
MLEEVEQTNAAILAAAEEVEILVAQPAMPSEFATVRWRFGQLSSRRSKLMNTEVYPSLMQDDRPEIVEVAKRSREELIATYDKSAKHIGQWSSDRIARSWLTYSRDVQEMLSSIRSRIERERNDLYPILRLHEQTKRGTTGSSRG